MNTAEADLSGGAGEVIAGAGECKREAGRWPVDAVNAAEEGWMSATGPR